MKYGVNEYFHSVQGEGVLAGTAATFIRLQGCTVGCPWCDTKYTWKAGGTIMTDTDIVTKLANTIRPLAVVTGGEPTIYNLDELFIALRNIGQSRWGHDFRIQVETSGQNNFKGEVRPDYLTWSPKRNLQFNAPDEIKMLANEVKWVVDNELRQADVVDRMSEIMILSRRCTVCVLMPEGCPPPQLLVDKALDWIEEYPTWRYGDRIQWRIGVK